MYEILIVWGLQVIHLVEPMIWVLVLVSSALSWFESSSNRVLVRVRILARVCWVCVLVSLWASFIAWVSISIFSFGQTKANEIEPTFGLENSHPNWIQIIIINPIGATTIRSVETFAILFPLATFDITRQPANQPARWMASCEILCASRRINGPKLAAYFSKNSSRLAKPTKRRS